MGPEFKKFISSLELAFKDSLQDRHFVMAQKGFGFFSAESSNVSKAINQRRKDNIEVNVVNWFDEFWLYSEIRLIENRLFFSLSVFQGSADDEIKNQLFRAEWDNYEDNVQHPQPHWHVYPVLYDTKVREDFETFMEMHSESGFEEQLETPTASTIVDLSKFHFALIGDWYNGKNHIHSSEVGDANKLVRWLVGLLDHIKGQLIYIK